MSTERPFEFGENWADFVRSVNPDRLAAAETALKCLLPELSSWTGSRPPTFLDIGCGSGLHSVAAVLAGAEVIAFDVDRKSVAATRDLAQQLGLSEKLRVFERSILDDLQEEFGTFDFVYSWGVLHHTGDVWRAIGNAGNLLSRKTTSRLALALYRPTRLDRFWVWEKRAYVRGGRFRKGLLENSAMVAWDALRLRHGTTPRAYRSDYWIRRGMSFRHDLRDWLGGYPYEAVGRDELIDFLSRRGLVPEREFVAFPSAVPWGVGGSGCDEFVFRWL